MRILHVIEATFAGVGRHVLDLVAAQAANGHQVHVAFSQARESGSFREERLSMPAVRWTHVPMARMPHPTDLAAARNVARLVKQNGIQIVHGHSTKGGMIARMAPAGRVRRVYTPNALYSMSPGLGGTQLKIVKVLERALSRRTHALIAVSPEELAHANELGLSPRTSVVIPNGIVPPERVEPASVRRALGLPVDKPIIGFVGRLDHQKAPERLFDIFERVRGEAHLVVVGDGPDAESLQSRQRERVHLVGAQPGTWAMQAMDIFLLPSRYEGFPYVLIEAAWLGLPIVASEETNSSYLATKYSAIAHSPGADIEAMATAVNEFLRVKPAGGGDLSEFTVAAMNTAVEALYQKVLSAS